MDDLEAETKDFAARRMNKSIHRALAGKNINQLDYAGKAKPSCGAKGDPE
jgi:hypothetical protein